MDWLTNFLLHTNTSLLNLILIQYCLAVYSWSAMQAAGAVLSIGDSSLQCCCTGVATYSPTTRAFPPLSLSLSLTHTHATLTYILHSLTHSPTHSLMQ